MEIVQLLIESGATVNAQIGVGSTAIDRAERFPLVQDHHREHGGKTIDQIGAR